MMTIFVIVNAIIRTDFRLLMVFIGLELLNGDAMQLIGCFLVIKLLGDIIRQFGPNEIFGHSSQKSNLSLLI